MNQRTPFAIAAATALAVCAGPSFASEIVYDGFDYTSSTVLGGYNGGDGWGGAWVIADDGGSAGVDDHAFDVIGSGLSFGTLPVDGLSVKRSPTSGGTSNRAIANRALSAGSVSTLMADNTTMWFSILYDDFGSGDDFAFFIGDTAHSFPSSGGGDPGIDGGGNAFGFASIGTNIHAIDHENDVRQNLSAGTLSANGQTFLLVGKIDWQPNGGTDTLTLYSITDETAPLPASFATMTADFDQSTFSLVSFWDRPNQPGGFDEIRLATSFEGALGVPEPSSLALLSLGGLLIARRRR